VHGRELTVVERFTTTSAPAVFERELLGYARYRESRKGFVSRTTVVLTERPGRYVHLDQWSGLDRLLRVVHEDRESLARLRCLGPGTRSNSELLISVGRMTPRANLPEAALVIFVRAVVEGEPERFELDFGALVGHCVSDDGFGGSDLLRSVSDPRTYTGLMWWRDAAACERVRSSVGYADRCTKLTATARITQQPAQPLREA
jgi:hypothetical protein